MHTSPDINDEDDVVSILWSRLRKMARALDDTLLSLKVEPDEQVILRLRRSWKLLFLALTAEFLAFMPLGLPFVYYSLVPDPPFIPFAILSSLALFCAGIVIAAQGITVIRWYFEVYVLTTKRAFIQSGVISRSKLEAPLDKVENVTVTTAGLLNRLFRIGDVELITAGKSGNIRFRRIDSPSTAMDTVNKILFEFRRRRQRLQRSELRNILGAHMTQGTSLEESIKVQPVKLPDQIWRKHPYVLLIGISVPLLAIFIPLVLVLVIQKLFPELYQSLGLLNLLAVCIGVSSIWTLVHLWATLQSPQGENGQGAIPVRRRALLEYAGRTTQIIITSLGMAFVLIMAILAIWGAVMDSANEGIWASVIRVGIPITGYGLFVVTWLILRVADWWNDQYILTHDRIVDIIRVPLVYTRRNQAPLAKVQNVLAKVSFFGRILDYGDVIIETAGAGQPIVFPSIWHPIKVQETIFRYVDALTEYEWSMRQKERQIELAEWLDAYRDLTVPPCDPPIRWPTGMSAEHHSATCAHTDEPPGSTEA